MYLKLIVFILLVLLTACSPRTKNQPVKDRATEPTEAENTNISEMTIYDFTKTTAATSDWRSQDDVVMGGQSDGNYQLTEEGYGKFSGYVSLENNGGFSSIYRRPESIVSLSAYSQFNLRLKGDGKAYSFRVKANNGERFSYKSEFTTSGEWETITIPFKDMFPVFRGNKLRRPNFNGEQMVEMQLLIGNKKAESFTLLLENISAE